MGRRYIGCEQLDYGENDPVCAPAERDRRGSDGVSKAVGWKGGGSFVFCDLAKQNQRAGGGDPGGPRCATLSEIYERILSSGFVSCRVDPTALEKGAGDFAALSLADQKRFLMEIWTKNLLYVNACDLEDEEFGICEADKSLRSVCYGED